jgi:N-methylhydantoinase B
LKYRFLSPGTISIHDDRWFVPPWGVNGGEPGKRARKILEKADGSQKIVANKIDNIAVSQGDKLHYITWGGGGWGDPLDRAAALVGKEITQGLVSVAGAKSYGVVAAADGKVDTAATETLRARMRAERPLAESVFNCGPDIETLRRNCLAETGLPAPVQPVWAHQVAAE